MISLLDSWLASICLTVTMAICLYLLINRLVGDYTKKLPNIKMEAHQDEIAEVISLSRRLQDTELFVLTNNFLKGIQRLVANNTKMVETILRDTKKFGKYRPLIKLLNPMFGNGVLTSTGDHHGWQRKILNPVFSPQQLKKYVPTMRDHSKILVDLWNKAIGSSKDGKKFAVTDWLTNLSLDIICDIGFGYDMKSQENGDSLNKFSQEMKFMANNEKKRLPVMILGYLFGVFPSMSGFWNWLRSYFPDEQPVVKETMEKLIEKRKNEILSGEVPETKMKDFLSVMLKVQVSDERMTNQLIMENIFTFLVAGQGTTRTAMTWMLYTLGKYPEVQQKLREDLHKHIANGDDLSFDELKASVYLDCVVKEILRMSPPIPFFARVVNEESSPLFPTPIPRSTSVFINVNGIHRDKAVFPEPDTFKPERFLPGNKIAGVNFLTFGYGIFNCIGKTFAMSSIKAALATLVLNFEFSLDEEDVERQKMIAVEMTTTKPVLVRVKKIEKSD